MRIRILNNISIWKTSPNTVFDYMIFELENHITSSRNDLPIQKFNPPA